jgi:hypothetical protein
MSTAPPLDWLCDSRVLGIHDQPRRAKNGVRIERHAVDATFDQECRELGVIAGRLPAEAYLATQPACLPDGLRDESIRTAASRSSKTWARIPESRSTPSVSCVKSFDPIEKPSK